LRPQPQRFPSCTITVWPIDLAGSASAHPECVIENQTSTDTRAAEDAQQVGSAAASTEAVFGHHARLHVVGQRNGYVVHLPDDLRDRYGLVPAGNIDRLEYDTSSCIDLARSANSDRGESGSWLICAHEQLLNRFLDGRKYGTRATRDWCCATLAGHDRVVVSDE